MDVNRIAIYLAGKFPPYYQKSFNRFEFVRSLRPASGDIITKEDTDEIKDYAKNDSDFFSMCLERLEKIEDGEELLKKFIEKLNKDFNINFPKEIFNIDDKRWRPENKNEFNKILAGFTEIPATEEIIAPLLCEIFPMAAIPRGHEKRSGEWGHDLDLIAYQTPLRTRYLGVQIKNGSITEAKANEVVGQLKTAIKVPKYASDGNIATSNEVLLIATGKIDADIREKGINNFWDNKNIPLLIWDRDRLYQMVLKYGLPQEPIPRRK